LKGNSSATAYKKEAEAKEQVGTKFPDKQHATGRPNAKKLAFDGSVKDSGSICVAELDNLKLDERREDNVVSPEKKQNFQWQVPIGGRTPLAVMEDLIQGDPSAAKPSDLLEKMKEQGITQDARGATLTSLVVSSKLQQLRRAYRASNDRDYN